MRLDIRRTGSVKDGDEVIGNETRVKVVKNKLAHLSAKLISKFFTEKGFPKLEN